MSRENILWVTALFIGCFYCVVLLAGVSATGIPHTVNGIEYAIMIYALFMIISPLLLIAARFLPSVMKYKNFISTATLALALVPLAWFLVMIAVV